MKGAYDTYWASKRNEWISKWCGQIIQTVSRTTWTKEVKKAYIANTQYFINYVASPKIKVKSDRHQQNQIKPIEFGPFAGPKRNSKNLSSSPN